MKRTMFATSIRQEILDQLYAYQARNTLASGKREKMNVIVERALLKLLEVEKALYGKESK